MGFYNLLLQIAVILENNQINKIQKKWVTRQNIHRENNKIQNNINELPAKIFIVKIHLLMTF